MERPKKRWHNKDFVIVAKDKEKTSAPDVDAPKNMIPTNTYKSDFQIIRREDMDKSVAIVKFKRLKPDAELPIRGTFGSAGYDICAYLDEDITIEPNTLVKIPTDFATSFRSDYVALIYSRSGLATRNGLVVAQGTAVIDSDYRGEWFIPLFNQSNEPQLIRNGDRIAQLLVQPVCRVKAIEVENFDDTKRGGNGFGSTGISNS